MYFNQYNLQHFKNQEKFGSSSYLKNRNFPFRVIMNLTEDQGRN